LTKRLAILVSSDRHMTHLVRLASAAFEKGVQIDLFLTGKAVLLTLAPQFADLAGKANVAVCDVSFRAHGLEKRRSEIPGVDGITFTNQAKHAQLLAEADRYLVF